MGPIDRLVKVLPPTTPHDEIQRMVEAGKIVDEGVYDPSSPSRQDLGSRVATAAR